MIKERTVFSIIIILLSACICFLIWYYQFQKTKQEVAVSNHAVLPKVETVTVRAEPITLSQKFIGTVVPIQSVEIRPYISGFIDKVLVTGGQHVRAGEILFIIQQRQYLAQKEVATANVESARAALNNAQIYLRRIERTPSKAISQTELDDAKTNFLSAQAKLKAAESQLTVAQVNYDYTLIQSPIDGVVGNVSITKGNYVSPAGDALIEIIQQSPIRVVFTMSNREYLEMRGQAGALLDGWHIYLGLPNGQRYEYEGSFQYTSNQVTADTSGIAVYADFPNPKGLLMANAYVNVYVEKMMPKAFAIDKNLVHLTDKGAFVYALENGKVVRLAVDLGMSIGNRYYIKSGLTRETVLILGNLPSSLIGQSVQSVPASQNTPVARHTLSVSDKQSERGMSLAKNDDAVRNVKFQSGQRDNLFKKHFIGENGQPERLNG